MSAYYWIISLSGNIKGSSNLFCPARTCGSLVIWDIGDVEAARGHGAGQ